MCIECLRRLAKFSFGKKWSAGGSSAPEESEEGREQGQNPLSRLSRPNKSVFQSFAVSAEAPRQTGVDANVNSAVGDLAQEKSRPQE